MKAPRRRSSDRGWRGWLHVIVRENAYRDIWLVVVSFVVWLALSHADDATQRIQQERRQTILAACESQNARHDGTLGELRFLLTRATGLPRNLTVNEFERRLRSGQGVHVPHGQTLKQLQASYFGSLLIINALAPKQDCRRVLAAATILALPPPRPVPRKHRPSP